MSATLILMRHGKAIQNLPEPVAWDLALLRAQNETFLYSALRTDNEKKSALGVTP